MCILRSHARELTRDKKASSPSPEQAADLTVVGSPLLALVRCKSTGSQYETRKLAKQPIACISQPNRALRINHPNNKVNGIHTVNKQTLETSEESYNYVFQAILRSKQKAGKTLFARRTYQRKGEVKSRFNGALKPKDSYQNYTTSCQWIQSMCNSAECSQETVNYVFQRICAALIRTGHPQSVINSGHRKTIPHQSEKLTVRKLRYINQRMGEIQISFNRSKTP